MSKSGSDMTLDVLLHDRWPLHRVHLHAAATKSVGEPAVCEAILNSLVTLGLEPDAYDTDESLRRPFIFPDAIREARGSIPQAGVFLRRAREPAYDGFWNRQYSTVLTFAFAPANYPQFCRQVADLADDIAAASLPDFAALVPYAKLRPGGTPLAGDDAVKSLLDRGCLLPSRHTVNGVGGLGYRTYLGPVVAEQLGLQRIASLPAPISVVQMPWGGWRIDLAPDPWTAAWPVIRAGYEAAMAKLAPANWFARPMLDARGFWRFTPPTEARWSPSSIKSY